MGNQTHEYSLLIQEHHLDTFGHVNNATYLQILEEARWDWITARGFGLEVIQQLKLGPTVLECNLKFRRELRLRQSIVIVSEAASYEKKILRVKQQVLLPADAAGKAPISCEGEFVMALFDLERRKLVVPTHAWLHAVDMVDRYKS